MLARSNRATACRSSSVSTSAGSPVPEQSTSDDRVAWPSACGRRRRRRAGAPRATACARAAPGSHAARRTSRRRARPRRRGPRRAGGTPRRRSRGWSARPMHTAVDLRPTLERDRARRGRLCAMPGAPTSWRARPRRPAARQPPPRRAAVAGDEHHGPQTARHRRVERPRDERAAAELEQRLGRLRVDPSRDPRPGPRPRP